MAETGAVFGGEHSAHYYFRDFWRADTGMLAALHVLAALGEQDGRCRELHRRLRALRRLRRDQLDRRRRSRRGSPRSRRRSRTRDGVDRRRARRAHRRRCPTARGSTCAPSNTEPLLRLNVEAADEAAMAALRDEVLALSSGREHGPPHRTVAGNLAESRRQPATEGGPRGRAARPAADGHPGLPRRRPRPAARRHARRPRCGRPDLHRRAAAATRSRTASRCSCSTRRSRR